MFQVLQVSDRWCESILDVFHYILAICPNFHILQASDADGICRCLDVDLGTDIRSRAVVI